MAPESPSKTASLKKHLRNSANLLNFSRFEASEMWISRARIHFDKDAQNIGQQADRRAKPIL